MMMPASEHNKPSFNRRHFISNTIKLAVLGSILAPLDEACNNKKTTKTGTTGSDTAKTKGSHTSSKKSRKKWSHESLVVNTKSHVMHFPTSKVYVYYDEILPKHLQEISLATWSSQLEEPVRLNKDQSGNILEILAMQNLANSINNDSLNAAINTLAKAFTKGCENSKGVNSNTTNFRLHELMLQLIALNNAIPEGEKWTVFNGRIKKPEQLRKRQKWMETETNFNERVKYILDHQNDYITRLNHRATKYSFT